RDLVLQGGDRGGRDEEPDRTRWLQLQERVDVCHVQQGPSPVLDPCRRLGRTPWCRRRGDPALWCGPGLLDDLQDAYAAFPSHRRQRLDAAVGRGDVDDVRDLLGCG